MEGFKKIGRNSQKLFKRLVKREDGTNVSNEKVSFTTRIFKETRHITWKIENFTSTPLKFGEYIESPQFSSGFQFCTKWRLRVYPRGKKSSGKLGFYLFKESPSVKVNVQFEVKVGNLEDAEEYMIPVLEEKNILMTSEEDECGSDVEVSRNKVNGKSIKIVCILNVGYFDTLDFDDSVDSGSSGSSPDSILSDDLKEIYSNGKFSDVSFQVGKKLIPAHKAILAARSQYFAAMFDHPMEESQTNVVNIEDVELPVFNDFLHYIYTNKVENLTVDRAIALYSVADKYVLDELRKLCTRVILANVCVDNVCKIAVLGDEHSDTELKSAANYVFRKFKHQIFETKEWKRLIDDRPHLVSDILRDVSSDLRSEC